MLSAPSTTGDRTGSTMWPMDSGTSTRSPRERRCGGRPRMAATSTHLDSCLPRQSNGKLRHGDTRPCALSFIALAAECARGTKGHFPNIFGTGRNCAPRARLRQPVVGMADRNCFGIRVQPNSDATGTGFCCFVQLSPIVKTRCCAVGQGWTDVASCTGKYLIWAGKWSHRRDRRMWCRDKRCFSFHRFPPFSQSETAGRPPKGARGLCTQALYPKDIGIGLNRFNP
jgi:hypothetical protein